MKLTPKQQAFADYYIASGNATESAIKAGYSKKTAKQMGTENLSKPYLKQYIAEMSKKIQNERIADMQEVKEFWSNLMRDDETEKRDRLKASEYIAKTNGAFLDKVEHSGEVVTKINFKPV